MQAYQFKFDFVDNLSAFQRNMNSTFNDVEQGIKQLKADLGSINKPVSNMKDSFSGLKSTLVGAFAVSEIVGFGKSVVDTLAQFEKFEAVLTNTLGSNGAAKQVLGDIKKFAASTPFEVAELTEAYVKLQNRGLQPNMEMMKMLGDLAASQGKSFGQVSEAFMDAPVKQFMRLQEALGINVETMKGGLLKFEGLGIKKIIKDDPETIKRTVLELSKLPQVAGSVDAISKTTGGMLSNLSDQLTQMKESIGRAFAPFLANIIPKITEGFTWIGNLVQQSTPQIQAFVTEIGSTFMSIANFLKPLFETLQPVVVALINLFGSWIVELKSFFAANEENFIKLRDTFGWIVNVISVVLMPILDGLFELFLFILNEVIREMVAWIDWFTELGKVATDTFNWIGEKVSWFGNLMLNVYDTIFPGFKNAFNSVKEWLYDTFIKPVSEWFGMLFTFDKTSQPSAEDIYRSGESSVSETYNPVQKKKPGSLDLDKRLNGGADKNGVSGGTNIKHITINIAKLIETQIVNAATIKESASQVKDQMLNALLGATNDVNYSN